MLCGWEGNLLAESNGSPPPGGRLIVTCGLTACTHVHFIEDTVKPSYLLRINSLLIMCSSDCLYTGISSGPNAQQRVWEAITFLLMTSEWVTFSTNDKQQHLNLAMKVSSDMKSSSTASVLSDANAPINRNSAQTNGLIIYSKVTEIMHQHLSQHNNSTSKMFLVYAPTRYKFVKKRE